MAPGLREALAPLAAVFQAERIRYAVIGSYAVAAWGPIRATQDIDIFCAFSDVNRLIVALVNAGLKLEYRTGAPEDPIASAIRIEAPSPVKLFEIDILSGIRGAPDGLLERVRWISLQDLCLSVASPEDTVVLKLIAGSPQDLADASGIIRVQGPQLSVPLIQELCPPGLEDRLNDLLEQ